MRITAAGNRSIVVWAGPDDQLEIARQLLGSSEKTTTIELVPVNGASVAKVIAPLKELFADAKSSSFFFEADTTRNAILVKGTPEQITELKAALKLLVQGGAPANLELIPLTVLEAAKAVETLRTLFPDAKGGALHLEAEPSRNAILVKGTPEQIAELKSALKLLDRSGAPAKLELIPLAVLEPAKAVETLKTLLPESKRGTLYLEADSAQCHSGQGHFRTDCGIEVYPQTARPEWRPRQNRIDPARRARTRKGRRDAEDIVPRGEARHALSGGGSCAMPS